MSPLTLPRHSRLAWLPALLAAATAAWIALQAAPARACGGCVAPTETPFAVDGHRMAVKVGNGETILWDQFSWNGDPADFAWILPLPAVGTVELAEDGFFEALEGTTAPVIYGPTPPPPVFCEGQYFFGAPNAMDGGAPSTDSGVSVYYEGTVGPYETVTIGATDPNELWTWLTDHGYAVPAAALPTVEWYVSLGSVFVALRLAPDFGVEKMQPVRVRYPTEAISFPLRMVAVGAGAALDLTLYVVSDRRFHALNYPDAEIADADLVWDSAIGRSNYTELFDASVAGNAGRTWVTEHAAPTVISYFPQKYDPATGQYTEPGRDDWNQATLGLTDAWVTRLRTRLAPDALDEDLFLEPSWSPYTTVSNVHYVTTDLHPPPPPPPCPDAGGAGGRDPWVAGACGVAASPGTARAPAHGGLPWGLLVLGGGGAAALALAVRRRRG
jgi:hypothetical protein